jgi:hypothetical protein
MRFLRRGVLRALAGGLVPALAAGAVLLSAGAAAAAPGSPRTAGPAPAPASLTPSQIRQLEAMAARGAATAAARIGWFLPADCKCSFANEAAFQKIMNGIFAAAASVNSMSVRSTPHTAIKLNTAQKSSRIPDIYYFRLNTAHPATGLGSINEFKVGKNTSQQLFQRYMDTHLLAQGHGLGANAFDRNQFLPVKQAVWWFVPKAGITYNNFTFITSLLARGINVVYLIDNPSAKAWPRTESKQRKAKDVKEIETNNQTLARAGLTNLVGPCLMVCPVG